VKQSQQTQLQQQGQHSNLLRCCYSAPAGRHVVAAADIAPGSLLLVEQPLAAVTVRQRRNATGSSAAAAAAAAVGQTAAKEADGAAAGWCEWCFGPLGVSYWTCTDCPLVSAFALHCNTSHYMLHSIRSVHTYSASLTLCADHDRLFCCL
jgi:hypothetical protein